MARYHFVTTLEVTAPRARVWAVVSAPESWPARWRWLRRVDVLSDGDPHELGARHRFVFGTALPYRLRLDTEFLLVDAPSLLVARASGDLSGSSVWQLRDLPDDGTEVVHTWRVTTTKRWMNVLAPVARPAFSWNHDVLMRDFGRGLAAASGGGLLCVRNTAVKPGATGFLEARAVRPQLDGTCGGAHGGCMQSRRGRRPRRWQDLSPGQQRWIAIQGAVQTVLLLVAARDLLRRPAGRVRGRKGWWALALLVQPVGPLAYLLRGRRTAGA